MSWTKLASACDLMPPLAGADRCGSRGLTASWHLRRPQARRRQDARHRRKGRLEDEQHFSLASLLSCDRPAQELFEPPGIASQMTAQQDQSSSSLRAPVVRTRALHALPLARPEPGGFECCDSMVRADAVEPGRQMEMRALSPQKRVDWSRQHAIYTQIRDAYISDDWANGAPIPLLIMFLV